MAFSDRFLGLVDTHEQTTAQSRYRDLINLIKFYVYNLNSSEVCHSTIEELKSTLEPTVVDTYAETAIMVCSY